MPTRDDSRKGETFPGRSVESVLSGAHTSSYHRSNPRIQPPSPSSTPPAWRRSSTASTTVGLLRRHLAAHANPLTPLCPTPPVSQQTSAKTMASLPHGCSPRFSVLLSVSDEDSGWPEHTGSPVRLRRGDDVAAKVIHQQSGRSAGESQGLCAKTKPSSEMFLVLYSFFLQQSMSSQNTGQNMAPTMIAQQPPQQQAQQQVQTSGQVRRRLDY